MGWKEVSILAEQKKKANRNIEQKYQHLYEELAKRLEYAESVDFRYEDIEIISMFDANGFRLTLGEDLYLSGQDDWSDF